MVGTIYLFCGLQQNRREDNATLAAVFLKPAKIEGNYGALPFCQIIHCNLSNSLFVWAEESNKPVSYTHLTLPTKRIV